MDKKVCEQFFDMLDKIVNDDDPWLKKHAALMAMASDQDETNLAEFIAWFDEREEGK